MKAPTRSPQSKKNRRHFLKAAGIAGAGFTIVRAESVYGTPANSALRLGIIGCGGRGNTVGREFVNNTETRIVALADAFEDRLMSTNESYNKMMEAKGQAKIPSENLFKGLRSYEKLVQVKDMDAVLVTSPPWFHPDHFEAAVNAKKHVYLEKPVSTDVQGAKKVIKIGQQVGSSLNVHVGFQIRYAPAFRALVERIHNGEIGDIGLVQSYYYTNDLDRQAKPGMSALEARLRNWVFDKALSGDILVEQNIHVIDILNWAFKSHPVAAMGTCGRKIRTDVGDVNDHFIMTYVYPGDVHVSFNSNQFRNKGFRDVALRFFGTKGLGEGHWGGPVRTVLHKEENNWDSGEQNPLGSSIAEKAKAFVAQVQSGKYVNQAQQGAESTLSAILGRTAAYKDKVMTWDKLMKSDDKWDVKIDPDALNGNTTAMK